MSKELMAELSRLDLLEYGSVITGDLVRSIIGVSIPEVGTKKDFDAAALAELAAVDYVRNILLGSGKYLSGTQGNYRILLPSENRKQVDRYMQSADKRLRRALKLSRNTPDEYRGSKHNSDEARILLKREGLRYGNHPN